MDTVETLTGVTEAVRDVFRKQVRFGKIPQVEHVYPVLEKIFGWR